ncbi:AraC family transcriptional regulator [Cohnella fermenti]|uniref:AraC family transcriptional regulator n=1 Tax=Cohnella fermenti TaxID=2565925 RepID=A0A4S4BYS1_9BACL|nr:AraC family transcriptional regulator [Cohnella fermenti]THF79882.1 AraC family transcriptional regulator [Cohnella fermenti]
MTGHSLNIHMVGYSVHHQPFSTLGKREPEIMLIRLQVKGRCKATVNDKPFDLEPGDLILSRPQESYQLFIDAAPDRESADYFMACSGEWAIRWLGRCGIPSKIKIPLSEDILLLWNRLVEEQRNLREDNDELKEYLFKSLCLTLERTVKLLAEGAAPNEKFLPYRIKRFIEQHATERLTLGDIASRFEVSVSTAVHLFKTTFSVSIIRYAVEVRLAIAAERILHTNSPLEEIADACGFQSYPYFCRTFRSRYKLPPSQYRTHLRP